MFLCFLFSRQKTKKEGETEKPKGVRFQADIRGYHFTTYIFIIILIFKTTQLYEYACLHLLTEMLDSSTFKRFSASVDSILESLEEMDLSATGKRGSDVADTLS